MESEVEETVVRESQTVLVSFDDYNDSGPLQGDINEEFSLSDRPTHRSTGYTRKESSVALLVLGRPVRTRERVWSTTLSSLIASVTMLLAGFAAGFPSVSVLQLQELPGSRRFDALQIDLSVALIFVGAVIGAPIAGVVADRGGRKLCLLLSALPYLFGYVLIATGHLLPYAVAFKCFYFAGCCLTGVGVGSSGVCLPVYLAEISSPKLRGVFGSFVQLFLNIGLLILYGVGGIPGLQYYYVALVGIGIVVIFELFIMWLPETPPYLYSRHKREKSICVLRWLRGIKVSIDGEVKEMGLSERKTYCETLRMFPKKSLLCPLILIVVLFFFLPGSGQYVIVALAGPLLDEAGVSNPNLAAFYSVGIAGVIGSLLSIPVVDFLGRRLLLIVGGFGLLSGSVMLGTQFYLTRPSLCIAQTNSTLLDTTDNNITLQAFDNFYNDSYLDPAESAACNPQYIPMAITGLVLSSFFFSYSWAPVGWILSSELFPLQVRGVANSICNISFWITAMIVGGTYLSYENTVRPWFAMWTFSLITLIGILFIVFFIPETKGKSLEEIQEKMKYNLFQMCKMPKKDQTIQSELQYK